MKTSNLLLLGAGAYALYYFSQVGVAAGTIQVVFSGFQIKSLTDYIVTLTVQNVSNVAVDVNSMTGNVLCNGDQVLSISDFTKRTVPANGQVDIQVEATPSLMSLPAAITNFINQGNGIANFTVTGNVNVSGLVLPFTLDKAVQL